MPTYQYACTECGEQLEVQQSFSDDALTVCPVCEGRLRKVYNAVGVVFKGSGFYRTDSRKGNGSDAASSGSSKSTSSSSTDAATSATAGSSTSSNSSASSASSSSSSSSS